MNLEAIDLLSKISKQLKEENNKISFYYESILIEIRYTVINLQQNIKLHFVKFEDFGELINSVILYIIKSKMSDLDCCILYDDKDIGKYKYCYDIFHPGYFCNKEKYGNYFYLHIINIYKPINYKSIIEEKLNYEK